VQQALAGAIHSFALCTDGRAFGWGCGSTGRTGVPQYWTMLHGKKARMKCYLQRPLELTELSRDERVRLVHASTSRRYMAAIGYVVGAPALKPKLPKKDLIKAKRAAALAAQNAKYAVKY
jgi:hypothetical protein